MTRYDMAHPVSTRPGFRDALRVLGAGAVFLFSLGAAFLFVWLVNP